MSDDDKKEFTNLIIERFGMSLDAAIEEGVQKGYSVDVQRELISELVKRLK